MKRWLVVGVESSVPWPTVVTPVRYGGHEVLLRPGTDTVRPSVALLHELPSGEAHELVRRLLSALCWAKGYALREVATVEGSCPISIGRRPPADVVAAHFRADDLPEPADAKAKLALALYREAQSLNSIPYRFLSLFKVVNVLRDGGKAQKELIASTLPALRDERARCRMGELGPAEQAAEYLYESGRCAVAHAFSKAVDPDRFDDEHRLQKDLPLMEALAAHLIEHELGVKSTETIWREHLYELEGFCALLGDGVVAAINGGRCISSSDLPALPPLSVRLRDHAAFGALDGLVIYEALVRTGLLILVCQSRCFPLCASITLDLANCRLLFDPTTHVAINDDGSPEALLAEIDRLTFLRDLLANGELEVLRSDTGARLGRCGPFMAANIDGRATAENINRAVAELGEQLSARVAPDSGADASATQPSGQDPRV